MKHSKDEGALDERTFESWDRTLSTAAKQQSKGRVAGVSYVTDNVVSELHDLAVELRDRLRFSEIRTQQLKNELHQAQSQLSQERRRAQEKVEAERNQASATITMEREQARGQAEAMREQVMRERAAAEEHIAQERQRAVSGLSALEEQVVSLTEAVQAQGEMVAEQERLNLDLQGDLAEARQRIATLTVQVDQALARAEKAEENRETMMEKIHELSAEVDETRNAAAHHETKHNEALGALHSTKAKVGELNHLQGLYLAAREELDRLDKENAELKEMMQAGAYAMTKSRILETVAHSQRQQDKSTPLFLTPERTGRARGGNRGSGGRRRSTSPLNRDKLLAATGVIYPPDTVADVVGTLSHALRTTQQDGSMILADAAKLASMAFLGPPASSYPTDPDKFVFVRVAGGFSPKYVGSDPLPKASGWVPKDVVRLVQAFKHSYGIKVEWRCWEPLLLMVDEVYRLGRMPPNASKAQAAALALEEKLTLSGANSRRYGGPGTATYPAVMQAGKIVQLRKELARAQRTTSGHHHRNNGGGGGGGGGGVLGSSTRRQREEDFFVRSLAEKDYHVTSQLGEAIGENQRLRHSLSRLEEELFERDG